MAASASFNNFGGMSSGPADLFGLIAFSLRRTESSLTVISVTEGTEPVRSLLARPSLVPILAKKSCIKFAFSVSSTARLPSSLFNGPILFLLTGFVASAIKFHCKPLQT